MTTPAMPIIATADELSALRNRPNAERARPPASEMSHRNIQVLLSASVMRSRIAVVAGSAPATMPSAQQQEQRR